MVALRRLLNKILIAVALWILSAVCSHPNTVYSSTGIYVYTDSEGVVHIGNSEKIRSRGKLFIDESPRHRIPTNKDRVEIVTLVENTARRHGVCPDLAKAVAQAESGFQVHAVSPKGAVGVMQLMPDTAKRFNVGDIYDPEQNIEGGIRYLKYLLDMFQADVTLAIAAYNSGENRVLRLGRIPNIQETQEFVTRVIRFYNGFRGLSETTSIPSPIPARVRKTVRHDGTIVLSNL